MNGPAMSGVAVEGRYVIVADKGPGHGDWTDDIFLCLDAESGRLLWEVRYQAAGDMDFTNSPRATPLIHEGKAYLLGAFGDLRCVRLDSGQLLWRANVYQDFGGKVPTWGACGSPLAADGKLILNPGASDASVIALEPATGAAIWTCPGPAAAYSSLLGGTFGGVRQIVGLDSESIGGWDPAGGRRLWTLTPPHPRDFNVVTPLAVGGRLLVCTENNGARLFEFDPAGRAKAQPVAVNEALASDTISPVSTDGLVFGVHRKLLCLSGDDLRTLWSVDDEAFADHVSLIAGSGRLLVATVKGELLLYRVSAERAEMLSRVKVFSQGELWSHPALAPGRLYLRGEHEVRCLVVPPS